MWGEKSTRCGSEGGCLAGGVNNRYGHPHRETLEALEELDVVPLGTGEQGNIVIHVDVDDLFLVNTVK